MPAGSCLCESVRYTYTGEAQNKVNFALMTLDKRFITNPIHPGSLSLYVQDCYSISSFLSSILGLDCRKISGSTFSTNIIVPGEGFELTAGKPKTFAKKADSGKTITSYFCGDCGSTLWRETPTTGENKIVQAGTLDGSDALETAKPDVELFTERKTKWSNVDVAE